MLLLIKLSQNKVKLFHNFLFLVLKNCMDYSILIKRIPHVILIISILPPKTITNSLPKNKKI